MTMDVGLPHLECQTFVERRALWDSGYKGIAYELVI